MTRRTVSGKPGSSTWSEPIDDDQSRAVAAYLLQHTDFLVHHPEVLAKLHVPHGAGGAVSLIEHQVAVLREQLGHERGRLNHLMARAHEYEQLSARLHELTVQLITAPDQERACAALEASLREQFSAEAVAIKLFPVDPEQRADDPLVQSFVEFIDRDRCLCGPLAPKQAEPLFGTDGEAIQSAALVPIRGTEQTGVLAIGSTDPKRFAPDMGTELLERLGAIAGAKLTDLAHRNG
ncbi:MAG: DUF484 family protein [Thiohalocapsa sp.]|jgi:hypothetical protein|uniref:DUF484 family protein n=1 Tax=Thiohalocapsa sp. TaxID=2497641 RepID=UPI0025DB698E|nr:DUF484 family protein [Thiohalocapsa sp.]MCG6940591.1 DUF484 family protein [Thiohalocapsa sp.]